MSGIEEKVSITGTPSKGSFEISDSTPTVNDDKSENSVSERRKMKQYAVSVRAHMQPEEPCCTGTISDCYSCFCCCSRRVGNMFFLFERRDGSPIFVAGPCWPFCTFVTFPLIAGIGALVTYYAILKDDDKPRWLVYIYLPLVVITLVSLFFVSCRDPGLLERVVDEEAGTSGWYWNEQVGSYRPPGALYCRECKVMIKDYDHLCPWTGTGIGGGNMFCFKVFVIMINISCYTSIAIVAYVLLKDV